MQKSKAFTLFELVVYMAATVIVVPLLFIFFTKVLGFLHHAVDMRSSMMKNYSVLTLIKRDVVSACPIAKDWDQELFVFKKISLDYSMQPRVQWVGWQIHSEGLRRIVGQWDQSKRQWSKKVQHYCRCSIAMLDKALHHNAAGDVVGVDLIIKAPGFYANDAYKVHIRLRNREA